MALVSLRTVRPALSATRKPKRSSKIAPACSGIAVAGLDVAGAVATLGVATVVALDVEVVVGVGAGDAVVAGEAETSVVGAAAAVARGAVVAAGGCEGGPHAPRTSKAMDPSTARRARLMADKATSGLYRLAFGLSS